MKNVGNYQNGDCWNINRVEPQTIEFWQGQSNRIHDRLRFGQIVTKIVYLRTTTGFGKLVTMRSSRKEVFKESRVG